MPPMPVSLPTPICDRRHFISFRFTFSRFQADSMSCRHHAIAEAAISLSPFRQLTRFTALIRFAAGYIFAFRQR
jgi:hypothetical protein